MGIMKMDCEQVGGLNPEFNLAMDADLWIRFSNVGEIGHVRAIWSRMRFYPDQKNRRLREASDQEDLIIRAREWGTDRPSFLSAKRNIAQILRLVWKMTTGCYPLGYRRYIERIEAQ
jgi:hypothetical protein